MRKTAQRVWEEAEDGQAFACKFVPEGRDSLEDTPEVVWVKGDVDSLAWSEVLWIAPISYEGGTYYG